MKRHVSTGNIPAAGGVDHVESTGVPPATGRQVRNHQHHSGHREDPTITALANPAGTQQVDSSDATWAETPPDLQGTAVFDATGDRAAMPSWDELVRQHADRVYRLAYRLSGNQHDAEDLTQETFMGWP